MCKLPRQEAILIHLSKDSAAVRSANSSTTQQQCNMPGNSTLQLTGCSTRCMERVSQVYQRGCAQWKHVKAARQRVVMARGPRGENIQTQEGADGPGTLCGDSFQAECGISWQGLSSAQAGACLLQSTSLAGQLLGLQQGGCAFRADVCAAYPEVRGRVPLSWLVLG